MMTNLDLTNQPKTSGQESTKIQRRALIGGAVAALLASPKRALAQEKDFPNDPFILLLHGIYQPVVRGPNLGLSSVNLNDGTYSTTKIYPIFGVDGSNDQEKTIGDFYVQFNGFKCAYDLPGGAIAMNFLPPPAGAPAGFNGFVPVSDKMNGYYLEGTFELTIPEATGIYQRFAGGHNHMVDKLHQLADGSFNEFCFCNISTYQFP
jgi:hypothetical protein